jgi:hypothetical protein
MRLPASMHGKLCIAFPAAISSIRWVAAGPTDIRAGFDFDGVSGAVYLTPEIRQPLHVKVAPVGYRAWN